MIFIVKDFTIEKYKYVFNMDEIYYHVRVILYDKPTLYDAVRDCFMGENLNDISLLMSSMKSTADKSISDKFILTQRQQNKLKNSPNETCTIICSPRQIQLYAHNCISTSMLHRILSGENPF